MRTLAGRRLAGTRSSDLILLAAMLVVGWSVLIALINFVTTDAIALTVAGLATCLQWTLLRRATKQPVPLPGILVVIINLVGAMGYLWYPELAPRAAVSSGMPDTADIYRSAATIFATASTAVFGGGLIGGSSGTATSSLRDQARSGVDALASFRTRRLLIVAALPLLAAVLAYTPAGLWHREHYSLHPGPLWAVKLASLSATAGVALASLLAARRASSARSRRAAAGLLLAYVVVLWAMGSRSLAIVPAMLLLMLQVDPSPQHSRARRIATLALLGSASLLLLQVPLALRGRPEGAGLAPYWNILVTNPASLVSSGSFAATVGNILFAVPLAAVTAAQPSFPHHYLITSVNPLPGSFTDWSQITYDLRLNAFTPTSALGELANYGRTYLVVFFVILGFVLARLQAWNAKLPPLLATLAAIAGFGVSGSFALALLQYNLRAGMRGIWYFLALSLALHLLTRLKRDGSAG